MTTTRVGALARAHWPFLAVLALGVALRVLAQFAHRPALFFNDSFGYLANSANLATDRIWPVGYALFLRPLLAVGDLATIPIVQHLMGLGLAVLLYVLVTRWGGPRWLATLAVVPLLLDGYQVQSEHRILAETLFTVLVAGGLAVLTWQRRPGPVAAVIGGLLVGLSVPVRHAGVALVVALAIGVVVATWGTGRTANGAVHALAMGALVVVAFAVPVGSYVVVDHQATGQWGPGPDALTDRMLYARVARYVDCDALDVPAAQRGLCPTAEQQATMLTDHVNWRPESPLNQWEPPPGTDPDAALHDFTRRALAGQPLDTAAWVARDTVKAFAPVKTTFRFDQPVERWRFQVTDEGDPRVEAAIARWGGGGRVVAETPATWLRRWQLTVGTVPPLLLGMAAAIGLWGAAVALRRRDHPVAGRALLWTLAGLGLVVLQAVYQFSWRYQVPTFALFPIAGAAGWQAVRAARRDSDPSARPSPPPEATTRPGPTSPTDPEPADAR